MKITFHGAAQEVIGSCTMIETERARLLVDCGMFQGGREAGGRNRAPFAFDSRSISFVILTHAHIDHSGLLPKLWRDGFRGPIYTTPATAERLEIMLRDSANIQETRRLGWGAQTPKSGQAVVVAPDEAGGRPQ